MRLAISDSHIQSAARTTLVDNLSAQGVNKSKRSRMVEQVLPPSGAIEGSRRLLGPGGSRSLAGHRREACGFQLIMLRWEGHAAYVHRIRNRLRENVRGKNFGHSDIQSGVLEPHVLDVKRQDWPKPIRTRESA